MSNGRGAGTVGAPFKSYVSEKRREKRLGRSLSLNKGNRSTAWGEIMEIYLVQKLGYKTYSHHGKITTVHPVYEDWAGSPDLVQAGVKVADIKCFEPDNFTKLADVILQNDLEVFKKEYNSEYWQLVSNACIHQVDKAEMVLFMPSYSELDDIRKWMNEEEPEGNESSKWKYRFIFDAPDYELPYIPDDCEVYSPLMSFEFEVPKEDKQALEDRVILAGSYLNNDNPII